jgi:hypothetical protein
MIEPLPSSSGSVFPRKPPLERRKPEELIVAGPVGLALEVDSGRGSVDQWREVCPDRRRQLRGVAEFRRDVGEVLDWVRVIALTQEGTDDPFSIAGERRQLRSAALDRAAQIREVTVFVAAIHRVVPADKVEQLVAGGQLDLTQSLIRLDPGGKLDLVAIRIETSAATGVGPDDPTAAAECLDLFRKAAQGPLHQNIAGCHVQVGLSTPKRPPEIVKATAGEAFDRPKHGAPVSDHEPSISGAEHEFRSKC